MGGIALVASVLIGSTLLRPPGADAAAGTSTITGSVFDDANRSATRDAGEAPFSGKMIELYTSGGAWVTSVFSDTDGRFRFDSLADGAYTVRFRSSDWLSMRETWVPTTTGSLYFVRSIGVAGTGNADFGLRRIVRSTTVGSPISAATAGNGTRFESYSDAVDAAALLAAWQQGALLGAQPSNVTVRFDVNAGNSCVTSVSGSAGSYANFSASVWLSYLSWLDNGDRGLFHEYAHAWTLYHEQIVQQEDGWGSYLEARGLAGDSRLYSDKNWDPREMIAEDYRQLFGSPNARSYALANNQIAPADQVPGLADWMRNTFTQPASGDPEPGPAPQPGPEAAFSVTGLAVNPSPVVSQGTVTFELNAPATVAVRVVDGAGRLVRTLLVGAARDAGSVSLVWDRKNDAGRKVKAGAYTVVVDAEAGDGDRATAAVDVAVVDLSKRR